MFERQLHPGPNGRIVIALTGEIDPRDCDSLRREIVGCLEPDIDVVVVDLIDVTYMGAGAIRALLEAARLLRAADVELRIGRLSPIAKRVLEVCRFPEAPPTWSELARQRPNGRARVTGVSSPGQSSPRSMQDS